MTIFVLFGIISWAIFCLIDVTLINERSIKTLFMPEKDWGPLLVENKRLAVHLENLEPYHDSKRVKKQRVTCVSFSSSFTVLNDFIMFVLNYF